MHLSIKKSIEIVNEVLCKIRRESGINIDDVSHGKNRKNLTLIYDLLQIRGYDEMEYLRET